MKVHRQDACVVETDWPSVLTAGARRESHAFSTRQWCYAGGEGAGWHRARKTDDGRESLVSRGSDACPSLPRQTPCAIFLSP